MSSQILQINSCSIVNNHNQEDAVVQHQGEESIELEETLTDVDLEQNQNRDNINQIPRVNISSDNNNTNAIISSLEPDPQPSCNTLSASSSVIQQSKYNSSISNYRHQIVQLPPQIQSPQEKSILNENEKHQILQQPPLIVPKRCPSTDSIDVLHISQIEIPSVEIIQILSSDIVQIPPSEIIQISSIENIPSSIINIELQSKEIYKSQIESEMTAEFVQLSPTDIVQKITAEIIQEEQISLNDVLIQNDELLQINSFEQFQINNQQNQQNRQDQDSEEQQIMTVQQKEQLDYQKFIRIQNQENNSVDDQNQSYFPDIRKSQVVDQQIESIILSSEFISEEFGTGELSDKQIPGQKEEVKVSANNMSLLGGIIKGNISQLKRQKTVLFTQSTLRESKESDWGHMICQTLTTDGVEKAEKMIQEDSPFHSKFNLDDIFPVLKKICHLFQCQKITQEQQIVYKSELELNWDFEQELNDENEILDQYIQKMIAIKSSISPYTGTDPIKDEKKIHRKFHMKRLKLKYDKQNKKYIQNLQAKESNDSDPFDDFGHGIQAYFYGMRSFITLFTILTIIFMPTMNLYNSDTAYKQIENYILPYNIVKYIASLSIGNLGYAKAVCTHQFIDIDQEISHKCAKGKISELKFFGLAPHILNASKQLPDDYSKQGGACRLPDGSHTGSTQFTVSASGQKGDSHSYITKIRTVDECKQLCAENDECTAFDRASSGEYNGVCSFQTVEVKGSGEGSTYDCYIKDRYQTHNDYCSSHTKNTQIKQCTQNFLKSSDLIQTWNQKCEGNSQCNLSLIKFVKLNQKSQNECIYKHSKVFIQYNCDFKDILIDQKRKGWFITTTALVACVTYCFWVYYLRKQSYINEYDWDVSVCTAADFTVQIDIPHSFWKQFKLNCENDGKDPTILKKVLKDDIEQQVSKMKSEIIKDQSDKSCDHKKIEITHISFAYANRILIQLLKERGTALKDANFDKIMKIEDLINMHIKKDRLGENGFKRPVAAFVTFNNQEGYERCLSNFTAGQQSIFCRSKHESKDGVLKIGQYEEQLQVSQAPEVSGLIWENLQATQEYKYVMHKIIGCLLVMVLILSVFIMIKIRDTISGTEVSKYPSTRDCSDNRKLFAKQDSNIDNEVEIYRQMAEYDKIHTNEGHGLGIYQCFCIQESLQRQINGGSIDELCISYQNMLFYKRIEQLMITVSTLGLNTILKKIVFKAIQLQQLNTQSQQVTGIIEFIFCVVYINTGFILMISTALFKNFPDFTSDWYLQVGPQIVLLMMVNAFMPIMEFFMFYMWCALFRIYDRGWSGNLKIITCKKKDEYKYDTKCRTVQRYVEIYGGFEPEIEEKYAYLMSNIYIAFTHGLALPILFPIVLLSTIILYISEKLQFTYFYNKPPLMNNYVNERILLILGYAPIPMMFFGYWQLTNRQMFYNEIPQLINSSQQVDLGHNSFHYHETGIDYSMLFLIFIPIFVFRMRIINLLRRFLTLVKLIKQYKEENFGSAKYFNQEWEQQSSFNEHIGNYFECLTGLVQKRWYATELQNRYFLGKATISDDSLYKLQSCKRGSVVIKDFANYNILENQNYADAMFSTMLEKRELKGEESTALQVEKIFMIGEAPFDNGRNQDNNNVNINSNKKDIMKDFKNLQDKMMQKFKQQEFKNQLNKALSIRVKINE